MSENSKDKAPDTVETVVKKPESTRQDESTEIAIIDERTIRDKIYEVRGVKVMLDFELAEIYGYETKNFNRQVKNNAARFEGDNFMFQLTKSEMEELSRCKNFTSIQTKGVKGGRSNLPYAFTEQGIYMLMTVLRGDLAIRQSRALVIAFKMMKDYIVDNQPLLSQRDLLRLSMQMSENTQALQGMQTVLMDHDDKLSKVFGQLTETVKRSEISPILLEMGKPEEQREYLLLNGEPLKADETYIDIYSRAKKSVYIVDNYVGIKTLRLLQKVQQGVDVIIFTDNLGNLLHLSDYKDFQTEFPGIAVAFRRTKGTTHDRFIMLDYGTADERVFHCGASSKDAGYRTTAITEFSEKLALTGFHSMISTMLKNPVLKLK